MTTATERGKRFLQTLSQRPLLLDAAMGTRLMDRGLKIPKDEPTLWNLARPEAVLEIHLQDIRAGSDVLLTNTFGANRVWFEHLGLGENLDPINRQGVALARQAAGPDRFVFGSIGPTADSLIEGPANFPAEREQANLLAEAGVDALLLETNVGEGRPGDRILALREATGLPVLYSIHSWKGPIDGLVASLMESGVSAIGCNCRVGMAEMSRFVSTFGPLVGDLPLLVKPGAGRPGGPIESPEAFARAVPSLVGSGVRLLGGCCGSTEKHLCAMRIALDETARDLPSR